MPWRRPKREEDGQYRLLDFVWQPILKTKPRQRTEDDEDSDNIQTTTTSALENEGQETWLSLAPDHRAHIKRWHDFNYPVLRVVLKDLLSERADTPRSGELRELSDEWIQTVTGMATQHNRAKMDWRSVVELGQRLNEALQQSTHQLHETTGWIEPVLKLAGGYSEQSEPQSNWGPSCVLEMDWTLTVPHPEYETPRCVVIGVNKSADDFPLGDLARFDENRKLVNEKVACALRQIGTVCWYKETPYAFILTSEGAALLLFSQVNRGEENQHKNENENGSEDGGQHNTQKKEEKDRRPYLGVRYVIVPWETREDRILELPLLMGLWALCVVALSDEDRRYWAGLGERLNSWHDLRKMGRKFYDHYLLVQTSRGHPPGAHILSRSEDPVLHPDELERRRTLSKFCRVFRPNGIEVDTESPLTAMSPTSIATSLIPTPTTPEYPLSFLRGEGDNDSNDDNLQHNDEEHHDPIQSIFGGPQIPGRSPLILGQQLVALTDSDKENRDPQTREEEPPVLRDDNIITTSLGNTTEPQPVIAAQNVAPPRRAKNRKKRKRESRDEKYEEGGEEQGEEHTAGEDTVERWTKRLRPRRQKPDYWE